MKKNDKNRFVLSLNTCLLYLLLLTLMFTAVSFAKYVTTVQGGNRFRVVTFVADATGKGIEDLVIDCGNPEGISAEYVVQVMNYQGKSVSDVAAEYWIEVVLPEHLPEGISMELYHGETQIPPVVRENTFLFPGVQPFAAAQAQTEEYQLKFVVKNPELIIEDLTMSGIRVNVIAEQIV